MFRSVLTFSLVIAVMAANLISPAETHARRCGEKEPETLLSLYKRSSMIFVATFDRIEDGGIKEDTESYTVSIERSHFSITSTLKGEPRKSVTLEEEAYKYKGDVEVVSDDQDGTGEQVETGTEDAGAEDEMEDYYGRPTLEAGDTVLLFLKKGSEEKEFEAVDYRDAIRKIEHEHIGTYETRINELSVIMNTAGDQNVEIANWLMNLIEDPITRWDGAFELLSGFYTAQWEDELEKEKADAEKEESEVSEGEEYEIEEWERIEMEISESRTRYARALTENQKQALLNLALSRIPAVSADGDAKEMKLSRGDDTLIELVKRWGDGRLAAAMLDQLIMGAGDAYYKYRLMETIATSLDDKSVRDLLDEYGDDLYMGDDEVVEDRSESGSETDPVTETKAPETGSGETERPQTYGERRAETLAKFIAAAQALLTTGA